MRKIDEALIDAVQKNDVRAIGGLVRKGANVNIQNEYGQSLLHLAIFKGNRNLLETLILLGADVNQKDMDGYPPLHQSIRLNRLKMMRRLLCEEKIDTAQTDKYGFSALHVASLAGLDLGDLKLLAMAGVPLNHKNNWGDTALFTALNDKTIENLLAIGVDAKLENKWGEKAVDYFNKKAFKHQKDVVCSLKYMKMAVKLGQAFKKSICVDKEKNKLAYLRSLKGTSFLKYKKMIWQNDRG
ncbi:MAG: ankyrin repeat domain-containing protein [Alphaproteobacteria bacterium]|nr:ankyrin repeat domain-containing protein [Alphaproteobacteria bacterium]